MTTNTTAFEPHPQLQKDTLPVCELPLCSVLLMNDARYPWVILVPRIADLREIWDLSGADQATLWREVTCTAEALQSFTKADKMNVASIGNLVPQLHIHVIARKVGDAVWPAPVWGRGEAEPYVASAAARQVEALRLTIGARRS
ncbi:MAG: HIT domain-containing protein [Gammaproteobacteria bacterium]|nr:HIT domain-containing protein [Gammaproteobacteria bacterium]